MSRRNKLLKFTENLTFNNVYEAISYGSSELKRNETDLVVLNGEWNTKHFKNSKPIILELACGRGEYCLALAERYPNINFIGVDIKGARIWKGAKLALENQLSNVAFLRTRIECIDKFFDEGEVDELWITFPDPFLRDSKYNRRLTSPNFLALYKKLLKPGGLIHLKTDSPELYEHSLEVIEELQLELIIQDDDIYASAELPQRDLDIKTYYERQHLEKGKKIKYLQFRF